MVEPGAARRFRWISVGVAWVSIALAIYWVRWLWYVASGGPRAGTTNFRNDVQGVLMWGWSYWVSLGAILVALAWGTAVAGWVAYSPKLDDVRANRAAVLARYTCAPLAWTPVVVLGAFAMQSLMIKLDPWAGFAGWGWEERLWQGVVWLLPVLELLACGWCVAVLARRVRGWGAVRTVVTAVALPLVWMGMAAATLYAAQVVAGLAVLLLRSWD
jgi:hypothetical protein